MKGRNKMNDEEKLDYARMIAQEVLADLDFSYVSEDEDLEEESEDTWRDIHDIITTRLTVVEAE